MTSTTPCTVYSRRDPLGETWPIRVSLGESGRRSFEVTRPGGETKFFGTVRETLKEIHGPQAQRFRTWSWDRYAQTGRYAPVQPLGEPGLTIVDFKGPQLDPSLQTLVIYVPKRLGVDLEGRHTEVAKLLYAGFGAQIAANGYDFEDVLQEVFRKLVAANRGTSPWDPSKSSFGHYVHMVCRSALFNYHRKQNRRKAHEQIGARGYMDGGAWGTVDVADSTMARTATEEALADIHPDEALQDLSRHLLETAQGQGVGAARHAGLAVQFLPLVRDGYGRGEIAAMTGNKPSAVSRALAYLRQHAATWRG